jgi:hypothetical protein
MNGAQNFRAQPFRPHCWRHCVGIKSFGSITSFESFSKREANPFHMPDMAGLSWFSLKWRSGVLR